MREQVIEGAVDRAVAAIAERQHGLITSAQLYEPGLDKRAIYRRVQAGRLHRLYRGVFAVGHTNLSREALWLAAVFACAPNAVLSHRSAAALWSMRPHSSGPIELTVPDRGRRAGRRGLRIHRSTRLEAGDVTRERAIPVTTPRRTIADLRRVLPTDQVDAAVRRAEILRLDLGRQPGYEPDRARSDLERDVLRICRAHRLPMPEVNVRIGPYEVDFLWRKHKLVLETDGYQTHGTRSAFEADRERDVQLQLMGLTCMRFTHRQVSDPRAFATTLRALLDADG
jgi:very-short-patch-repair endonuclease